MCVYMIAYLIMYIIIILLSIACMCIASLIQKTDEYNNRRAEFDKKAREMTRKYAMGAEEIEEEISPLSTKVVVQNQATSEMKVEEQQQLKSPIVTGEINTLKDVDANSNIKNPPSDTNRKTATALAPLNHMKENMKEQSNTTDGGEAKPARKSRLQKRKIGNMN